MVLRILALAIPLVFVLQWLAPEQTTVLFLCSLVALIPASLYIERITEHISEYAGETIGGFLNATFGNMPELFIGWATLNMGLYQLLSGQLIGGILVNILFVIAVAMLVGGMYVKVQTFSVMGAGSYFTLLLLASIALCFPSIYLSQHEAQGTDEAALLSLVIAIILFIIYLCYVVFSMVTHKSFLESIRDDGHDEHHGPKRPLWQLIVALLVVSVLAVLVSDTLISTIEPAAAAIGVNQVFMGVIVLGVIGNVSGLVTATSAARKNRMDLAFSVAIGSSVQQILFVVPVLVFMSYMVGPAPFDLAFPVTTMCIMLLSVITLGALVSDGQSHWLKGAQLLSLFAILIAAILILT